MTEAEWFACEDPAKMLTFLEGRASRRKLILFSVQHWLNESAAADEWYQVVDDVTDEVLDGKTHLMYDSRDFGAMPILADALQDAGCGNEDILKHCRDPHATHVRGCWVVDLVLAKE